MEDIEIQQKESIVDTMVKHDGIISKVTKDLVTVTLSGNINCEGCKAKAVCGASESSDKEVEVPNESLNWGVNESVTVLLKKHLAVKAVFFAYIFPFILLLGTLLIASNYLEEWAAGLLALFILVPYYMILYVLRPAFKKEFKVSILKTSQL